MCETPGFLHLGIREIVTRATCLIHTKGGQILARETVPVSTRNGRVTGLALSHFKKPVPSLYKTPFLILGSSHSM